jgi:hypothetical protein
MRASIDIRVDLGSGDATLAWGGLAVAVGSLLSGVGGLPFVMTDPQPAWSDAATYIAHFRAWHQVPFWFGFAFIAAWVALNGRLAALAVDRLRTNAAIGLIATAMFGAMILTNYLLQAVFVPHAVRANDFAVAYLTMANPGSIGWMLEMFGYGALGVASWVMAPIFPGGSARRRWIVWLMIGNGVLSLAGALATGLNPEWVLTLAGLAAYAGWNAVVFAAGILIAVEYRPRVA